MASLTRGTFERAWKSWLGNDLEPHGPAWLQLALTGLFCAVLAVAFTVLGMALNALDGGRGWQRPDLWWRWYGTNLAVSMLIGYLIHGLFALLIPAIGRRRIRSWSEGRRSLFFAGIPIFGVMVGWPLAVWIVAGKAPWMSRLGLNAVVGMLLFSMLVSGILHVISSAKSRQVRAERQAMEAQLRLLQAQMEPHFLFNTLANVVTLIETEPARARRMLETFTDYLRSSLAGFRGEDSSVGRELDLAEAFLRLQQLRMEDRLQYAVRADDAARALPLAPLLLQPLVENAVLHGLEPKIEGGRVEVDVRIEGQDLVLRVADDGLGPDAPPRPGGRRNGVALTNLRERLEGRYGDRASLAVEPARPGTQATLRLPL